MKVSRVIEPSTTIRIYLEEVLRSDKKWFLRGGKTVIWAPHFPLLDDGE